MESHKVFHVALADPLHERITSPDRSPNRKAGESGLNSRTTYLGLPEEFSRSQVKPVLPLDSRPTFCARRETIKPTSVWPTVCGEPSTGCGNWASPLKRTTPDSVSIRRMDKAALPRFPTCTLPS